MKRITIILSISLLTLILLAACGAAAPPPRESIPMQESYANDSPVAKVVEQAPAAAPAATEAHPSSEQMVDARKIVYNADMTLIVEDPEQAAQEISKMAVEMGGYVASMNGHRRDDSMVYDVTIRIPAQKFETSQETLRQLAVRVESEQVSTDDVTDRYYDIDARLRTLKATEEELTELLKETRRRGGKVEDIMKIYDRLIQVRSEIESLQGQLNRLDKLVAFSTLNIHLQPSILSEPIENAGWHPAEIARGSAKRLVKILTGLASFLIEFVIVIVPVLLVLLVPLALIVWAFNSWRKRKHQRWQAQSQEEEASS